MTAEQTRMLLRGALQRHKWAFLCQDDALMSELAALLTRPTPDREGLERIIDRRLAGDADDRRWRDLVDEIFAWAQGTQTPRWCKHMVWNDQRCDWQMMYPKDIVVSMVVRPLWAVCPICTAPRPKA